MNEQEKNEFLIGIFKRILKDERAMYVEVYENLLLIDGNIAITEEEFEALESVLDE